MTINIDKDIAGLNNATLHEIQTLPDLIKKVILDKSTSPDAISELNTKPNITIAYLMHGLTPDHIRALPDAIISVGINGNTPLEAIRALSTKPKITMVSLGRGLTNNHLNAMPDSIRYIRVSGNTPTDISSASWERLRNKEPNVEFYFSRNVSAQQKEIILETNQQQNPRSMDIDRGEPVLSTRDVKENRPPRESDPATFFRPIKRKRENNDYDQEQAANKIQKLR